MTDPTHPSSFRDPSGALFFQQGILYRRVDPSYRDCYDRLLASGLYFALTEAGLLVPHEEVSAGLFPGAYRVIRPELVQFISYPYEWCFGQLKDAALTTLRIQSLALDHGMCLKDASAYNIQFHRGKPLLIDTLSFEEYQPDRPWIAYRQFCQHFLAPLALMARTDIRLGQLLRVYIDGLPLDLVSSLLPRRTWLHPGLLVHLHLHAGLQARAAGRVPKTRRRFSEAAMRGLVDTLRSTVESLRWRPRGTQWADYYEDTNYTAAAREHKRQVVARFVEKARPRSVWDLGANLGLYSRLVSDLGIPTLSFDLDPAAVEKSYRECRRKGETHLLPLVLDLTNPSPGLGWAHEERASFLARGPADMALALALIHHLAIGNNVPFQALAAFFARVCRWLVVEFVPKSDSQVQRLLSSRDDIFVGYSQEAFERDLGERFDQVEAIRLADSQRVIYLMRRKGDGA